jgi:hypothetical protein
VYATEVGGSEGAVYKVIFCIILYQQAGAAGSARAPSGCCAAEAPRRGRTRAPSDIIVVSKLACNVITVCARRYK